MDTQSHHQRTPGTGRLWSRGRRVPMGAELLLTAAALALPALLGASTSPAGETLAITQWTVDGGGGRSAGGALAIEGTVGQPDTDPLQPATGGAFTITGGFWPAALPGEDSPALFANGFE